MKGTLAEELTVSVDDSGIKTAAETLGSFVSGMTKDQKDEFCESLLFVLLVCKSEKENPGTLEALTK